MPETPMAKRALATAASAAERLRQPNPLQNVELRRFAEKYGKTPFGIAAGHLRSMSSLLSISDYYKLEKLGYQVLPKTLSLNDFKAAAGQASTAHYRARNAMEGIEGKIVRAAGEKAGSPVVRGLFKDLMGETSQKPEEAKLENLNANLAALRRTDEALWQKKRVIDRFVRIWEGKRKREEAARQAAEARRPAGVPRLAPAGAR